ncbi:MAG: glycosyltransferase family 2 protein [Metamycoplasmataceae bacterium]
MNSETRPKISVLIACYNEEKGLPACLDAIIEQSFKDIEIIVVNDGSTDNSLKILEYYQTLDSKIRVITQKNSGIACVRNLLISEAKGIYITFVDADDFLEKEALKTLYDNCENEKQDIVFGKSNVIFNQKHKTAFLVQRNNSKKVEKDNFFEWNICVPWGWIGKTDIIKNCPKFLPGWVYEDLIINYFFLEAKKIKIIKNVVYNYCRYPNGNHISSFNKNKIWDLISIKKQMSYFISNLEKNGKLKDTKVIESINSILIQPLWVLVLLKKHYGYSKKISNLVLADAFSLISSYNLYFQISQMHWKFLSHIFFKFIFYKPKKIYKDNKPLKLKNKKVFIIDDNLNLEKFPKNCFVYINSNKRAEIINFINKNNKKIKMLFIHNEILTLEQRKYILNYAFSFGLSVGIYYDNTSYDFEITTNKIMAQDFSMITHVNFYKKIEPLLTDNRIISIYSQNQLEEVKSETKQLWNILIT